MPQYIWLATFCFFVLSLTDLSKAEGHCSAHGRCEGRESITFKALIGHTFVTIQTLNPEQCHERCREDIRCQSLNFVIRKGLCELNNRSRETKPQRFVFDAERFYFRRWPKVILGSTEEIPAESCKEINLNENGKASSGIYWLDLKTSDKITQVYCDMQSEVANFCVNHQCLNGASCVSIDKHYECACLPGWNGTYCHSFAGKIIEKNK
ncbi:unnamed protein product [Porites lobata]|uniref:EGF-like domain-containing protein n=1 Tax=Porites lobata TaxID=104759 RepID=A0ABN8NW49_9CNID|nr:unnamed protein product [Porites lobata]